MKETVKLSNPTRETVIEHEFTLGYLGLVLSTAGAVAAATAMNLGPLWSPIALALTTLPCAWLGGVLFVRGNGRMAAAR